MQIDNLPNKESKVMIIIMLYELGGRMDEHSEKLNKELENIKKNQTELKNTITEVFGLKLETGRSVYLKHPWRSIMLARETSPSQDDLRNRSWQIPSKLIARALDL